MKITFGCTLFAAALLLGGAPSTHGQSDLDYYSLMLVNRARTDPGLENSIQGTAYVVTAVTPLAYDPIVGDAATNHMDWMFSNTNNPAITSGQVPRTFSHYETDDGTPGGTPLVGSPDFTGATSGDRITAAGYTWSWSGENILFEASTVPTAFPLTAEQVEINHAGWWNSTGHRNNMVFTNFRVYGYDMETMAIADPVGANLPPGFSALHYGVENYAAPLIGPQSHLFGLLYEDNDLSGDWTMLDDLDPLREGLAGLDYVVVDTDTDLVVFSGTTFENGAFTAQVADGIYDVIFDWNGTDFEVSNVSVLTGLNTDLGLINASLVPEPGVTGCLLAGWAVLLARRGRRRAS